MADNESGVSASTVFLSFLAGAAVGAGMALLVAPKTGKEFREKIADITGDAVTKVKDYANEAQSKIADLTGDTVSKVKDYANEAQSKITATFDEGKELLKEKKSILSAAIEAGKGAMEREKEKQKEA